MPQQEIDLLIRFIPYEAEGTGARAYVYRVPVCEGEQPGELVANTSSLNTIAHAIEQAALLCQGRDPSEVKTLDEQQALVKITGRIAEELDKLAVEAGTLACASGADPRLTDLVTKIRAMAHGVRQI